MSLRFRDALTVQLDPVTHCSTICSYFLIIKLWFRKIPNEYNQKLCQTPVSLGFLGLIEQSSCSESRFDLQIIRSTFYNEKALKNSSRRSENFSENKNKCSDSVQTSSVMKFFPFFTLWTSSSCKYCANFLRAAIFKRAVLFTGTSRSWISRDDNESSHKRIFVRE